jgi:hypothetical protein
MNPSNNTKGKDLSKMAPRSPHIIIGGYAILARTIDKCRADISGTKGEYHFDCPLDNQLFGFKGIKGADFKAFVIQGKTDDEILVWVNSNGTPKTAAEIAAWSAMVAANNYSSMPEKKPWLEGENARLGLDKDGTLFDFLDADDKASFK